jgi:hypothetical protein
MMADSKDETGRGASRPYATIDLEATEVGGKRSAANSAGGKAKWSWQPLAATLGILGSWRYLNRSVTVLTPIVAGLAGGLLALLAWYLLVGARDGEPSLMRQVTALTGRLTALERGVGEEAASGGLRRRLEALARDTGTLQKSNAELGAELKAVRERSGANVAAAELADRLAKLENAVTALSASAGGDGNEVVRAGLDRFQREIAGAKADAGRLAERLERSEQQGRATQAAVEALQADLDRRYKATARADDLAPLAGRLAALDRELTGFINTEADRTTNATRVVLSLELSNLKRAIERGDSFATELAAAKKVAGDRLNLARFDRFAKEGLPPLSELAKSFRKAANAMLDAETEPVQAPLFERLLSGAKSIVRIRKSGHPADDDSLEATIARMETALKENRLGEVLAQAKKLPPKAALAGEDWLSRVEMRYAIEQALADTEAALKSSLAANPAGTDRRQ